MDPISIGILTSVISTPIFAGIYTLGNLLHDYATTAPVNTVNHFIPTQANALVVRAASALVAMPQQAIQQEILPTCAKLVASDSNAVALRAETGLVAVKQLLEPVCNAVIHEQKPLMIAPPPTASAVLSPSVNYTDISKGFYDLYQLSAKVKQGEYVSACAYTAGVAIDFLLNETAANMANVCAESIGVPSALYADLIKSGSSLATSFFCRTVLPMVTESAYQYFYPKKAIITNVITAETSSNSQKTIDTEKKTILQTASEPKQNNIEKTAEKNDLPQKIEYVSLPHKEKIREPKRLTGRARSKAKKEQKMLAELLADGAIYAEPETVAQIEPSKPKNFFVLHHPENKMVTHARHLKAVNDDLGAAYLDGAKFVADELKSLFAINTVMKKEEKIKTEDVLPKQKSRVYKFERFDAERNTEAHRSYARMSKAEKHLREMKSDKYTDSNMLQRAEDSFKNMRELFEKDSAMLTTLPECLPKFGAARI